MYKKLLIGIIVLVVILILFFGICDSSEERPDVKLVIDDKAQEKPVTMMQLTEGEKIDYVIDKYFKRPTYTHEDNRIEKENEYVNELPLNSDCKDSFDKCELWAAAGECIVNPEFMLYKCAKSCESCALSPQEKYNVTAIYNNRAPASCVYHGDPYPDRYTQLYDLYDM